MAAASDKEKTAVPSFYILRFENVSRQAEILKELDYSGWAGEVVRDFKTQGTGRLYVAIVLNRQDEPTHICRLLRRGSVGLNRIAVGLSEIEAIEANEAATLKAAILSAASNKRKEKAALGRFARLFPEENRKTISAIEIDDPVLANRLREKGRADDRMLRGYSDRGKEIVSLERDSLGLALEIAFGDREALLVDGLPPTLPGSFLEMLGQSRYIEDEIIAFDKARFPGMEGVVSENPRVKVFNHNGSTLEVIHANRNDLEHTLGVDLIYVSHYYQSFIGLQYKMLEGTGREAKYTPDDKFKAQLGKMMSAMKSLSHTPPLKGHIDYRLHSGPFFFKFVARLETNFAGDSLCPGLYLPFDLVERIASNDSEKIGEACGTRHLSNSEFASMFRQGWLGTSASDTAALQRLIADALQGRRSLTIAVDRRKAPKERGRRKSTLPK